MSGKKKHPMTRSENMSRIRGRDTKIEIYFRKLLWHRGFRYRTCDKRLPGKPDIYISRYRTAIFVHGCFWHQHEGCRKATVPKKHRDFWQKKFAENRARDASVQCELENRGIRVITVWECEIIRMRKDDEFRNKFLDRIIAMIRTEDIPGDILDDRTEMPRA